MRDFLEDAHAHRDDGYGRAQAHTRRDLPKRFYTEVGVAPADGGYAATLDGRATKTPGMVPVIVPNAAIAEAMAEEWRAQEKLIDFATMPMVRLVNSAIERGEGACPALRAEIVKYAGNDLLLYRADTPEELVRRQEQHWDSALVALARHFSIRFQPTIGILHQPQPQSTIDKIDAALAGEGLLVLAALNALTGITGSGLLAVALWAQLLDAEQVWAAAHVDEDHNVALWGEVEEIIERRAKRRRDFDAAVKLVELMQQR